MKHNFRDIFIICTIVSAFIAAVSHAAEPPESFIRPAASRMRPGYNYAYEPKDKDILKIERGKSLISEGDYGPKGTEVFPVRVTYKFDYTLPTQGLNTVTRVVEVHFFQNAYGEWESTWPKVLDEKRVPTSATAPMQASDAAVAETPDKEQEDDPLTQLKADPRLKSESITVLQPDELVAKASSDSPTNSELGKDVFYEIYAERLKGITNAKFPAAAKSREQLIKTLTLINDFFADAAGGGSGYGHESRRIPARVEWSLFNGLRDDFSSSGETYTAEDVRILSAIIARSMLEGSEAEKKSKTMELSHMLRKVIDEVEAARSDLPEKMRNYLLLEVMRYLAKQI